MSDETASPPAAMPLKPRQMVALHWFSALAIVVAAAAALTRETLDAEGIRRLLLGLHQQAGLLVGLMLPLRWWFQWRAAKAVVPPPPAPPALLRWAAAASHGVIYLILLSLPLLGWALSNAHGQAVSLFGVLPLPTLVATDPDLAESLEDWHVRIAWGLAGLVALHAGAALWHHFVRGDQVLRNMLPGRRSARLR